MQTIRGKCEELEARKTKTNKTYYTFKIDGVIYSTFKIPKSMINGDIIEFESEKSGEYNNVKGDIRIIEKNPTQTRFEKKETDRGQEKLNIQPASQISDLDTVTSEAAKILSKCKRACIDVMGNEDPNIVNSLFIYVTRELRR